MLTIVLIDVIVLWFLRRRRSLGVVVDTLVFITSHYSLHFFDTFLKVLYPQTSVKMKPKHRVVIHPDKKPLRLAHTRLSYPVTDPMSSGSKTPYMSSGMNHKTVQ